MGKLHQLLAVESDLADRNKVTLQETRVTFEKKPALFFGFNKHYESFDADDKTEYPEEQQALTTTVPDRLSYQARFTADYLDAVLQKEATNQLAIADLVVDGETIMEKVPATFLLALEHKLKDVRDVYKVIPTLPQGVEWDAAGDIGKHVFTAVHPEKKFRTRKTFQHKILVEPTEHHPAQVEKWEETENCGMYVTEKWSGMVTSARKAELLDHIDKLIIAVKTARQKANSTEVVKVNVGDAVFAYINK